MFVIPHSAPEGYEWFVGHMVLVGSISPFAILCGGEADLALAAPSAQRNGNRIIETPGLGDG